MGKLVTTQIHLGSVSHSPALGVLKKLVCLSKDRPFLVSASPYPDLRSLLPAAGLERVKLCKEKA